MKRVAAIAIIHDHHMMMGRRRDSGKFTNPGGHLNPGEDPLRGAVREVKEETGLDLDPHLFKHIETRIVRKPGGEKIEVHGFRVNLPQKPSTSMVQDPDEEVRRWQWIKLDSDLEHIKESLHVPMGDNVLLDNILKDKPMRKHTQKFWDIAKKVGVEGSQQYLQHKERKSRQEKKAEDLVEGGKADGKPDSAFPQDQLRKGMKVEREHTKNPQLAKEIAKDHLKENSRYYDHLQKMEKELDKKAFWVGFEKKALQSTKGEELALAAALGQVPFATTAHTALAERPEGHSRPKEWAARVLAQGIGAAPGMALMRRQMGGSLPKDSIKFMGGAALGILGGALGEAMAHNAMISKYYDEHGKLKKEFDKNANEEKEPGWLEKQIAAGRAMRRGDKGMGRFLASDEVIDGRTIGGLKGGLLGLGIGAGSGAAIGGLLGKNLHPFDTLTRTRKFKAILGAMLGGGMGLGVGRGVGVYKHDQKHLKEKGIDVSNLGLKVKFSPEAKAKYIDAHNKDEK